MAITPDGGSKRAVVWSIAPQPVGEGQATKNHYKEWCNSLLIILWKGGSSRGTPVPKTKEAL